MTRRLLVASILLYLVAIMHIAGGLYDIFIQDMVLFHESNLGMIIDEFNPKFVVLVLALFSTYSVNYSSCSRLISPLNTVTALPAIVKSLYPFFSFWNSTVTRPGLSSTSPCSATNFITPLFSFTIP